MRRTCHSRGRRDLFVATVSCVAIAGTIGASADVARAAERQGAVSGARLTCPKRPCFPAFLWLVDYSGSASLVRDSSQPGQRVTHQQIDTSWSLPVRLARRGDEAAGMFLPRDGRSLPARWKKPSELLVSRGRRSVFHETTETYRSGSDSFTCTGEAALSGSAPIQIATRLARADRSGGYVLEFRAPEPQVLPPPGRTTCSPPVTTGGRHAMAFELGDEFDLSLPPALIADLHPTASQLRRSAFTVSANVSVAPATSCAEGTACTQSLQWKARLRFRRRAACLVPLYRGPAECSR